MENLLSLVNAATDGLWLITHWLINNKEMVGVVVAGSGVVSLSLEPIKRWLTLQNRHTINILHYLFALIAVGAHYVATSSSSNPLILFAQALVVLGTNQFVYPLITKPLTNVFFDAKAQANVQKAEAQVKQLANSYDG